MKKATTDLSIPSRLETQVSAPVVRVLGGGERWTAHEADAAELVYSLSSHVLVKARRKLRKVTASVPPSPQQHQYLVELIQRTQILRKADSLTQFEETVTQLRLILKQLAASN